MTNEQARLQASAPKVFVYIIHKQNIERKFFRIPFLYNIPSNIYH